MTESLRGGTEVRLRRRRLRPAAALLAAVSRLVPGARPRAQKLLIRAGYRLVNRSRPSIGGDCLNYGYAPLAEAPAGDPDGPARSADHYGLLLYARVAGAVDLSGRQVLEVGCGRGGGSAYLARSSGAGSVTGVDLGRSAVAWCRRRYRSPNLRFLRADAEDLPFPAGSFDAVVNVESAHCYPRPARFFREAHRVLRPGGHLLFADLRPAIGLDDLRTLPVAAGFEVVAEELITGNVVRALELDADRRIGIVERLVPRALRPAVGEFMALPGTETFEALRNGRLAYLRLVLLAT